VLLFRRSSPDVAAGWVVGDYQYRRDLPVGMQHVRTIQWVHVDIPRAMVERELVSAPALAMVHRVDDGTEVDRLRALVESDAPSPTVVATAPSVAVSEGRKPLPICAATSAMHDASLPQVNT
jgi:predicted Mrr-cat superfamily restriction endonuclease